MKTFILFIFGTFEDHEDIAFFCTEILGNSTAIKSLKYVIESSQNIIVIFDSDTDYFTLSKDLFESLSVENVKFYFLIERDTLVTAHLPAQVKDFIFKPQTENSAMILEYSKNDEDVPLMDLDEVLDKIEKWGIESLTSEEKNFLDNFE
jgi:hypothetical protein